MTIDAHDTPPPAAGGFSLALLLELASALAVEAPAPDVGHASPMSALGLDSFGLLELFATIEDRYGAVLDEQALPAIATVGDLVRAVRV